MNLIKANIYTLLAAYSICIFNVGAMDEALGGEAGCRVLVAGRWPVGRLGDVEDGAHVVRSIVMRRWAQT